MATKAQLEQEIRDLVRDHANEIADLHRQYKEAGAALPKREVRLIVTLGINPTDFDDDAVQYVHDAFDGFFGEGNENDDGAFYGVELENPT